VELRLAVEEVKEPLVVEELSVPLLGLVIPEVVSQGYQKDIALEQPGFLPVLVQQQGRPGAGKDTGPARSPRVKRSLKGGGVAPIMYTHVSKCKNYKIK
jgi:hypothetical protein